MEPWVLSLLGRLATFTSPNVCRHFVALEILNGVALDHPELQMDPEWEALVEAFSKNSEGDSEVLQIVFTKSC